MQRRDFIRTGVVAGIAGAVPIGIATPVTASTRSCSAFDPPVGPARNIIFFAYDGFGHEDLAAARVFAARHLDGRSLTVERLHARGASGLMLPHSLDSIVTDSAAASAAWATGQKVMNYRISTDPDGQPLTTIMELAAESGRATGLITSTRITHATPAAWIAKVESRDMEDEIALQYLDFRPDLLLGGGSIHSTRRGAATTGICSPSSGRPATTSCERRKTSRERTLPDCSAPSHPTTSRSRSTAGIRVSSPRRWRISPAGGSRFWGRTPPGSCCRSRLGGWTTRTTRTIRARWSGT